MSEEQHLCQRCLQILKREVTGAVAQAIGKVATSRMTVHYNCDYDAVGKEYWDEGSRSWNFPACTDCYQLFLAFCMEEEKKPNTEGYVGALREWIAPICRREEGRLAFLSGNLDENEEIE